MKWAPLLLLLVAGSDFSPEQHYNRALRAVQEKKFLAAEIEAEKSAVLGGPLFYPLRDFLLGNTAFSRCLLAEAEAELKDADPTALDRAILLAKSAGEFWQSAAVAKVDWLAARRNAERAYLKLEDLRKKKKTRPQDKKKEKPSEPEKDPASDPEEDPRPAEETPQAITRLFEKLARKQKEKRDLRTERRRFRSADLEKDW